MHPGQVIIVDDEVKLTTIKAAQATLAYGCCVFVSSGHQKEMMRAIEQATESERAALMLELAEKEELYQVRKGEGPSYVDFLNLVPVKEREKKKLPFYHHKRRF